MQERYTFEREIAVLEDRAAPERESAAAKEKCKPEWLKFLDAFPEDVRTALKTHSPEIAVVMAIHHGIRDLGRLTKLLFLATHGPNLGYCMPSFKGQGGQLWKWKQDASRTEVRKLLARPSPPLAQTGGVTCREKARWLDTSHRPENPPVNLTGRYEHRYLVEAEYRNITRKWTVTDFVLCINQAGRHLEGILTTVNRLEDLPDKDRSRFRFRADLQPDGTFVYYGTDKPDVFWGYLTHESGRLHIQQMTDSGPKGSKQPMDKVSPSATLMESAFEPPLPPRLVHLHQWFPLTAWQIQLLRNNLREADIVPFLAAYFSKPPDNRVAAKNALAAEAYKLGEHLKEKLTHMYYGLHKVDYELGHFYAQAILATGKWTHKGATRSLRDWIQIMLDVLTHFGFQLPQVTTYLGLKPSVKPGGAPPDAAAPQHKYKVSFSLKGALVYFRGRITVEKVTGTTWKETYKITLKGLQVKPGVSISGSGEAESPFDWTPHDIPGPVEFLTAKVGVTVPGAKVKAGAWIMHLFGSRHFLYLLAKDAEIDASPGGGKKVKIDPPNLGGLWGEIYSKDLPDKDYSTPVPTTDYAVAYGLQDDVHFCLGSALLTEDARQALRIVCASELAGFLSPLSSLKIVGHTDTVRFAETVGRPNRDEEDRRLNLELSLFRTQNTLKAIREILGGQYGAQALAPEGRGQQLAEEDNRKHGRPNGKPDPRFRRVDVFLNARLVVSLRAR